MGRSRSVGSSLRSLIDGRACTQVGEKFDSNCTIAGNAVLGQFLQMRSGANIAKPGSSLQSCHAGGSFGKVIERANDGKRAAPGRPTPSRQSARREESAGWALMLSTTRLASSSLGVYTSIGTESRTSRKSPGFLRYSRGTATPTMESFRRWQYRLCLRHREGIAR